MKEMIIVTLVWIGVAGALCYLKGRFNWRFKLEADTEMLGVALIFWPIAIVFGAVALAAFIILAPFVLLELWGERMAKRAKDSTFPH